MAGLKKPKIGTHHSVDSKRGKDLLVEFLDEQIAALTTVEPTLRESVSERISTLHGVFSGVIEDAISIRLLLSDSRLNQAYIICRAFLERLINYCYLQIAPAEEFQSYCDYTLNKAGRRPNRTLEAKGKVRASIKLANGCYELPPDVVSAIERFTSERGREKTRWTGVGLPERAAVVQAQVGATGLFMSLLTVYSDASEALHGTIYGSVFHLGVYDQGAVPHDQESLDRHRYTTISCLSLIVGETIHTLLAFLAKVADPSLSTIRDESRRRFDRVALDSGLADPKETDGSED